MAEYILAKVVHYGAFKKSLDQMIDILQTEYASSVVIRGNSGCGKNTLLQEAFKLTNVKSLRINTHWFCDDYAAMKAIAIQLGFKARGAHIADLMKEIKGSIKSKEKLVIVLSDFEEFCRQRQSLLYNLMNLIHTDPNQIDKSPNLTLVGLTNSLDWSENIEKRVRSRLNAKCIGMPFPYTNSKEFIEFTSSLLENYEIDEDFQEHLEYIYTFTPNPSLRALKKYLSNMVELDQRGKLMVRFDPTQWNIDYQINPNNLLRERLRLLTRSQLDILKMAVYHCFINGKTCFTLNELNEFAKKKDFRSFSTTHSLTLCDLSFLLRLKLVKPFKSSQPVSQESVFYPSVTPRQFKAVIQGAPDLQSLQTDPLWKILK